MKRGEEYKLKINERKSIANHNIVILLVSGKQ